MSPVAAGDHCRGQHNNACDRLDSICRETEDVQKLQQRPGGGNHQNGFPSDQADPAQQCRAKVAPRPKNGPREGQHWCAAPNAGDAQQTDKEKGNRGCDQADYQTLPQVKTGTDQVECTVDDTQNAVVAGKPDPEELKRIAMAFMLDD